jgi:FeS assembly SUF system protein
MKPLPLIQPSPPVSPAQPESQQQTMEMVCDPERTSALRQDIVKALSNVFDPEIPVNVYDLGLIYDILVDSAGVVGIRMTLTAPACPAAQFLPVEVKNRIATIPGVTDVKVDIVWEPPWDRDRMSDAAKLQLGIF